MIKAVSLKSPICKKILGIIGAASTTPANMEAVKKHNCSGLVSTESQGPEVQKGHNQKGPAFSMYPLKTMPQDGQITIWRPCKANGINIFNFFKIVWLGFLVLVRQFIGLSGQKPELAVLLSFVTCILPIRTSTVLLRHWVPLAKKMCLTNGSCP